MNAKFSEERGTPLRTMKTDASVCSEALVTSMIPDDIARKRGIL